MEPGKQACRQGARIGPVTTSDQTQAHGAMRRGPVSFPWPLPSTDSKKNSAEVLSRGARVLHAAKQDGPGRNAPRSRVGPNTASDKTGPRCVPWACVIWQTKASLKNSAEVFVSPRVAGNTLGRCQLGPRPARSDVALSRVRGAFTRRTTERMPGGFGSAIRASSRASAAPRRVWMPLPNAMCGWGPG